MALSFPENAFPAPVVGHQEARGQTMVDTGVYGVVRDPLYAVGALLIVSMPLWFASHAGAVLAMVPIAMLVLRILFEERFLERGLVATTPIIRECGSS